jgi:hypothetical protein
MHNFREQLGRDRITVDPAHAHVLDRCLDLFESLLDLRTEALKLSGLRGPGRATHHISGFGRRAVDHRQAQAAFAAVRLRPTWRWKKKRLHEKRLPEMGAESKAPTAASKARRLSTS